MVGIVDYWLERAKKGQRVARTKKEIRRQQILDYLGDPSKDFPDRSFIALSVCGYKEVSSLYKIFTKDELGEIEREGLDLRRKKYAPELSKADKGLLKRASEGDPQAVKLCYQKFENWKESSKVDVGVSIKDVLGAFPDDVQEALKKELAKRLNE